VKVFRLRSAHPLLICDRPEGGAELQPEVRVGPGGQQAGAHVGEELLRRGGALHHGHEERGQHRTIPERNCLATPVATCHWFRFVSALVLAQRVRAERLRGHARPALPVGGVLLFAVHQGRDGAHLELQLRHRERPRSGALLPLRLAGMQGEVIVGVCLSVTIKSQ
jgi:hypothetical protein